ncbi:MAG: c-type cytochrome domain-containing protein [Ardenticatenia bacterium]|nr:c-type cytochrome domain-containing protein [Ardenticatenia bacterium]
MSANLSSTAEVLFRVPKRANCLYMGRGLAMCLASLAFIMVACSPAQPEPSPTAMPFSPVQLPRATPKPVTPVPTVTPGGNLTVRYGQDIQPILDANCVRCHGGVAGLWLIDYEQTMMGSINGPVVVPGVPEASPLYTYVRDQLMPPDAPPLDEEAVERIRRWIEEGAHKN